MLVLKALSNTQDYTAYDIEVSGLPKTEGGTGRKWTCNCAGFTHHKITCIHLRIVFYCAKNGFLPSGYSETEEGRKLLGLPENFPRKPLENVIKEVNNIYNENKVKKQKDKINKFINSINEFRNIVAHPFNHELAKFTYYKKEYKFFLRQFGLELIDATDLNAIAYEVIQLDFAQGEIIKYFYAPKTGAILNVTRKKINVTDFLYNERKNVIKGLIKISKNN